MEALTPWHLALILLGFILLFGYKKLPDATRSLGRSLRIFKSEMRDLTASDASAGRSGEQPTATYATEAAGSTANSLEEQARRAELQAAELRARAEAAPHGAPVRPTQAPPAPLGRL